MASYSSWSVLAVGALALAGGCAHQTTAKSESSVPPPSINKDGWVLQTSDPAFVTLPVLWNGIVGFRFGATGELQSSLSIREFEGTGEEKIRERKYSIKSLEAIQGSYLASLDMRTGLVTLKFNGKTQTLALAPGATKLSDKAGSRFDNVDIEIDGPVEDQQAVRSFIFYLRSAIDPRAGMSVSPYGLSSSTYNGHVFWDADTWVFPALALLDPDRATAILTYRRQMQHAAQLNAKAYFKQSSAAGTLGVTDACKYPWESSVSGKETAPGESKREEHISGDVAWAQHQGEALGLVTGSRGVVTQVGNYYRLRSSLTRDERQLLAVMSPDENHIGDNDLYTNLLAQWCMNGGKFEGPTKFHLPKDAESFLTYDGDSIRGYKQAAAVLSIYPLQYPPAEAQAHVMMNRFSDKVTKNGPAMTDSIHALIWARIGETEKAYETWHKSWKPFVFGPFMQFSEKRSRPATYFVTGAAGSLQTVLYGFLGIRIDSQQASGSLWSKHLPTGEWLSIKPNLPTAWKSVKLKGFTLLGERYTLTATHASATVTPYRSNPKENP